MGISVRRTTVSVSPVVFCKTASRPSSPARNTQCSGQGTSMRVLTSTSAAEKPVTAAFSYSPPISFSSAPRVSPTSRAGSFSRRWTLWPQGA